MWYKKVSLAFILHDVSKLTLGELSSYHTSYCCDEIHIYHQ